MTTIRTQKWTRTVNGNKLSAEISPCVFMHKGYPLQLTVQMKSPDGCFLGQTYPTDRSFNGDTVTEDAVKALLKTIKTVPCKNEGCAHHAFDPETIQSNRDGECEICFMKKLRAEFDDEQAKEQKKIVARDKQQAAKGMTHRVTAWVHPRSGDDYQVDFYTSNPPSKEEIADTLRRARSTVFDDYEVVELKKAA